MMRLWDTWGKTVMGLKLENTRTKLQQRRYRLQMLRTVIPFRPSIPIKKNITITVYQKKKKTNQLWWARAIQQPREEQHPTALPFSMFPPVVELRRVPKQHLLWATPRTSNLALIHVLMMQRDIKVWIFPLCSSKVKQFWRHEREKEPSSDPARRRASTATGTTSLPTPSPGSTAMVYRLFGVLAAHLITEALLKVCLVAEINATGSCVVMTCNPRAPAI